MEDVSPDIEYEFSLRPDPDPVLGQYVLRFAGAARCWDGAAGEERIIGEIDGYRLDLAGAAHDGLDQATLLESVSSELADFSHAVLGGEGCLLPDSDEDAVAAIECDGIVYISELQVDSAFRGHGVGTALLKKMASMVDVSNCLIALKAFPLAAESEGPRSEKEIAKVKHFYERMGFVHADAEFMVKDARLCESMRKKLARHRKKNTKY